MAIKIIDKKITLINLLKKIDVFNCTKSPYDLSIRTTFRRPFRKFIAEASSRDGICEADDVN